MYDTGYRFTIPKEIWVNDKNGFHFMVFFIFGRLTAFTEGESYSGMNGWNSLVEICSGDWRVGKK